MSNAVHLVKVHHPDYFITYCSPKHKKDYTRSITEWAFRPKDADCLKCIKLEIEARSRCVKVEIREKQPTSGNGE